MSVSFSMRVFLIVAGLLLARPIFAGDKAPQVRLTPFSTGHFFANYANMVEGGESKRVRIPIPVYLIQHPTHGAILFDSGLGRNFKEQTEGWWVHRLFQRLLPYEFRKGESAVEQLEAQGVDPDLVKMIILSHFHYDHAGGLADFPAATIVVSEEEWRHADTGRFRAELRGYRKEMYEGLEERVRLIEYFPGSTYGPFDASLDLFGDGSLILLETPGHTPGHQSLLVKNVNPCPAFDSFILAALLHKSAQNGPLPPGSCDVLLTGDAVWVPENYERPAPKGWFVRRFEEEEKTAWETTLKIRQFHDENPRTLILTGHDPGFKPFW